MKVLSTISELQLQLNDLNLHPVGFVPTMGALHEGHLSLAKSARDKCPLVVVSIFVNPTQFNDKNDLRNYPRTLDHDLDLLTKVLRNDDLVFTPSVEEIYPREDKRRFCFGNLDNVMEALHRPGHFNGVAQVVSRLFEIVNPDTAFFGQKDFQQIAVVKALIKQTGQKLTITSCPIVREKDGLAMSSRNVLLEPEIRKNASVIYKTLSGVSQMILNIDIHEIKRYVAGNIEKHEGFKVEYFEIVDDTELVPVSSTVEMKKDKVYFGCIAVQAGKVRLIDNIKIELV